MTILGHMDINLVSVSIFSVRKLAHNSIDMIYNENTIRKLELCSNLHGYEVGILLCHQKFPLSHAHIRTCS